MPIEYFNNLIEIFGAEKSRLDVSAMDGGAVTKVRFSFAFLRVACWCGLVYDIGGDHPRLKLRKGSPPRWRSRRPANFPLKASVGPRRRLFLIPSRGSGAAFF